MKLRRSWLVPFAVRGRWCGHGYRGGLGHGLVAERHGRA